MLNAVKHLYRVTDSFNGVTCVVEMLHYVQHDVLLG